MKKNNAFLRHEKFKSDKEHSLCFFVEIIPRVTLRETIRRRIQDQLMWIDLDDEDCEDVIQQDLDTEGNPTEYLGLLDTGSTGGLISQELVKKYDFKCKKSTSIWDANAGDFKTGEMTDITGLRFPQFANKRKLDKTSLHVNTNGNQRYKIIFGLDFLIENKFDFLLSTETIKWQGIEISIHNNDTPRDKNECASNGKQLQDNSYKEHTGESVAKHKNAEHLSANEKYMLSELMSQFTAIMKGTVGNYKNMEMTFEMDKNKDPYHVKPCRIPVYQINLMKRAINEMVKNKALSEYNGNSPWAAPKFGAQNEGDE